MPSAIRPASGRFSAGAIRYRAYSRLGLTPEDIGRVIAFVTLSFGLGLAGVSAIALMIIADEIAPADRHRVRCFCG